MKIVQKKLITNKTARVFISGNNDNPDYVYIICHGYGQLANFFIRKFSSLVSFNTLLICPEALSRFYKNGPNGRVGASWMTKEDRLSDISDYIFWLDNVYAEFIPENSKAKIILLGFSQGGAAACRWLAQSSEKIDYLILYGATVPLDVNISSIFSKNNNGKIFLVIGTEDEFIDQKEKENQLNILASSGKEIELIDYKGSHDICEEALLIIKNKIIKKDPR